MGNTARLSGCSLRSSVYRSIARGVYQADVSIHSLLIRRLTPRPTDRGRADCPSLKGGGTEKDFIGFAVLSTTRFPLKGEVSNHKGIFDEQTPLCGACSVRPPERFDGRDENRRPDGAAKPRPAHNSGGCRLCRQPHLPDCACSIQGKRSRVHQCLIRARPLVRLYGLCSKGREQGSVFLRPTP